MSQKVSVKWVRGFLNTEGALKLPVTDDWPRIPGLFHTGCYGTVRQCPYNPYVAGCDGCKYTGTHWRSEFRVRLGGQKGK